MISSKLKAMLTVAFLVGASTASHAGSTPATVAVSATLTPGCSTSVTGSGAFSYAGATNAAITNQTAQTVTFTCTRGLTLSGIAWDTTNGTNTSTGTTSPSATTTGTVAGLQYTMDTGSVTASAGNPAVAATGTAATAATYVYTLKLSVPANQPGDASDTSTSVNRTLTLSY
jgi:hypothetical protein